MKGRLSHTAIAVGATLIVTIAAVVANAQATPAPQEDRAAPPAPSPATVLIMEGKVVALDPGTMMLTVSTRTGEQQFLVPPPAQVFEGPEAVEWHAVLRHLAGRDVTIRYTETGGRNTVESVEIPFEAPPWKTASSNATLETPSATTGSAVNTLVAMGKITSYDADRMVLTVATGGGDLRFSVPSSARVFEGHEAVEWHPLLQDLVGHEVTIRYVETNTAQSVRVALGKAGA